MRSWSSPCGIGSALVSLLRVLDGQIPRAVLFVEANGRICGAALPAGTPVRHDTLEGRALGELLKQHDAVSGFWLPELRRNRRLRLTLDLGFAGAQAELEAEAVLVDGDVPASPGSGGSIGDRLELRAGIDSIPAPLLAIDVTGRIRAVNGPAAALLGGTPAELIHRPLASLIRDPEARRRLKLGLSEGVCEAMRCALGRAREIELEVHPVPAATGTPRGWLIRLSEAAPGVDPDRSSLPAGEAGLKETLQGLTHDLRNPLCSLRSFTRLLEQDCGAHLGELGRRYLSRLRSNVDRLQALLEELAEQTRIRGHEPNRCWTASGEVLASLAAELKPELEERGIRLVLPEDPPPVFAHPRRLAQVILNLLQNAIHHMGKADDPEIRVSVEAGPAGTTLEVRDNGQGISPELRIFELLSFGPHTSDWRTRGLGLTIVKRIVQSHGGHVEVDSRPGSGATFRAFFPGP